MSEAVLRQKRAESMLAEPLERIWRATDRTFIVLMAAQLGLVVLLTVLRPAAAGTDRASAGIPTWSGLLFGALLTLVPIALIRLRPGRLATRCAIGAAQMLLSVLLIRLTEGRFSSHLHVFASLAFLAFYRDWRVLAAATLVVALFPMLLDVGASVPVGGALTGASRFMDYAGWVACVVAVLIAGCVRSVRELRAVAPEHADLEAAGPLVESRVNERTQELASRTAELAAANAQIHAILDGAADSIITIDVRGRILRFNKAAEQMFGYSADEAIGRNVSMLMPSPHREQHDDYLRRHCETGHSRVLGTARNVTAQRSDGSTFPASLHLSAVNVDGAPLFTGILRDKTGVAEAEAIRLERERCTALVADVAVALNFGGTLRAVLQKCTESIVGRLDAAFARVWTLDAAGTTLELQASAGMYTHIDGGHACVPVGKFKIGRIAANRQPHLTNDVPNDPNVGDPAWAAREGMIAFAGYPLIVNDALVGVVALFSRTALSDSMLATLGAAADNIASGIGRRWAEERLAKTQTQLLTASRLAGMAEVATGVLHNVGNALNSVNVSATVVKERVRGLKIDNLGKATAMIQENADKLDVFLSADEKGKRLPGYLLKLAESLAGEQTAILNEIAALGERVDHIKTIVSTQQTYARAGGVVETLTLSDVVEDALGMHLSAFERHGITLVREFEPLEPIQVDKHRLLQILLNLLSNARQAMREPEIMNRTLTVRIGRRGEERVAIEIIDTGVGIAAENITRIFSHGFTTKPDGHGFGLHGSANAAKEMGGSLAAQSAGPGAGATFILELPVCTLEAKS